MDVSFVAKTTNGFLPEAIMIAKAMDGPLLPSCVIDLNDYVSRFFWGHSIYIKFN